MGWWQAAGAVVESCDCDHYRENCSTNREYGPHRRMVQDRTGHQHTDTRMVVTPEHPRGGWPVAMCECGWQGFPTDYYEHLPADRTVEVLS